MPTFPPRPSFSARAEMLGVSLLAVVVISVLSGCKVTAEDIDTWKGTVKGPGKIVAVLMSNRYPVELRTHAAQALIEMERPDQNGLEQLSGALPRLDAEPKAQIVNSLADLIVRMMAGEGTARQGTTGVPAAPTELQKRAKDAALIVIPYATPEKRTALTQAVMRWYAEDLPGRQISGTYSLEQVVEALGSDAAAQLVTAATARMPLEGLVKIAELVARFGDARAKQTAADRYIAISREMETAEFLGYLREQVRASLAAGGRTPDEARITLGATTTRERFFRDGALTAMKSLADVPAVANRLLEVARREPAAGEDARAIGDRRSAALIALRGKATREHLNAVLDIATNANSPPAARDAAFDLVSDIGGTDALPRLWPLVTPTMDRRLRWRVLDLVLALGGPSVVAQFFERLPAAADAAIPPEEIATYAQRLAGMNPAPTEAVRGQLRGAGWAHRVVALRYFERRGTLADVPTMQALVTDAASTHGDGWPANLNTVGKIAENAIEGLRTRVAAPAAAGAPAAR